MKLIAVSDDGTQTDLPQGGDISTYIKKQRAALGMSLVAVGTSIGVTRQAVWVWERGKSAPSLDNLVKLVQLFNGISVEKTVKAKARSKKKK